MHFRNLTVIAPFVLLAGCGGAGSNEGTAAPESAPAAEASAPATEEVQTATAAAAPAETPPETPATQASASPAASTSPVASTAPAVAAAAPAAVTAPAAFAVCRACHSVEPGKNGVGPTLHGIYGSTAGEVPGYAFSPALKKSGIVWNREKLDTWLQGPMKMVPGTKMVITVPNAASRKDIIDYLETLK